MKLKDDKNCQCMFTQDKFKRATQVYCRYDRCALWLCADCGFITLEMGPVFCKHNNQWYRKMIYLDMDVKTPVSIKRSILMRKQNQPRKH